jgi:hypothetical protein
LSLEFYFVRPGRAKDERRLIPSFDLVVVEDLRRIFIGYGSRNDVRPLARIREPAAAAEPAGCPVDGRTGLEEPKESPTQAGILFNTSRPTRT